MIIPKHLQHPGMTEDEKKRLIAWIESKREKMKAAPAFDSEEKAIKGAVQTLKREEYSNPSVWKEPEDIGQKYAVVVLDLRETAQISGYKETVDEQRIVDIAKRRIDEIEEV